MSARDVKGMKRKWSGSSYDTGGINEFLIWIKLFTGKKHDKKLSATWVWFVT
jgi:hypothetical protein